MAPDVSKFPIFAGIVRLVRYQMKDTLPPPRRSASPLALIVGHDESSKPDSPACGWMSYDVLYPGMAFAIAGPSTILASIVLHCAPNTADPSGVIRSTTCAGTREGGICGAGGVGATAEVAVACPAAIVGVIMGAVANAAHVTSRMRSCLRIFPPLVIQVSRFEFLPPRAYSQSFAWGGFFTFDPELLERRGCQQWHPLPG